MDKPVPLPVPLTIAVCQPKSVLHDLVRNVEHHVALIRSTIADVLVFPELSLTGYSLEAEPVQPDDERLAPLVEACAERDATVLVGAVVHAEGGGLPNIAMLQVDRTGASIAYRKMFLGDAERGTYQPGRSPSVITVRGRRLGLAICKDTGVPEQAARTINAARTVNEARAGIDVYVSGVCEHVVDRNVPAERAARVRADHGVWVAAASFAGPTGGGFSQTAGHSGIWRNDGWVAAALDESPGQAATATIT